MKVLALIKKSFETVDIKPYKTNQNSPFNVKNMLCLFVIIISLGSSLLYLFVEANSFGEYVNSCFIVSSEAIEIINFINIIWKTPKLYEFFYNLENTIEKSKYQNICNAKMPKFRIILVILFCFR